MKEGPEKPQFDVMGIGDDARLRPGLLLLASVPVPTLVSKNMAARQAMRRPVERTFRDLNAALKLNLSWS